MKKTTVILLSMLLLCSFTACENQEQNAEIGETVSLSDSIRQTEVTSTSEMETFFETPEVSQSSKILIVYFSRYGNTEYPDDIDATTSASIVADGTGRYGTTEYVAKMIQQTVGGDIHRIETVTPYTADFDELRDLNHKEMQQGFLPELKESDLNISSYDTVFIGYPVWATDVPQAVLSFLEEYDLSGKTVVPFCTHDGYGAGQSYQVIAEASHAAVSPEGIAIEAMDVPEAQNTITDWLENIAIYGFQH
ncbi:MAG: flavodoxin [Oscillospiraceae bacterium]